jgi:casein kinase II subunit beta
MSTSSGTPESWISSFCSLLGHEYFAEVSEEFIEDDFNLTGLQSQVAMYKEALEVSQRRVDASFWLSCINGCFAR